MGLYDRDYTREGFEPQYVRRMRLPQWTPIVKYLIIANVAVFLAVLAIEPLRIFVYSAFQLDTTSFPKALQLWRLISYQFLHDPNSFWHIAMNMIGLFFLGPTLERHWGSRKFLTFYLGCGAAGGAFYMLLVVLGVLRPGIMVGASGAILGMLAACAILFPHFVVFFFLFPVPIRLAAIVLTIGYIAAILANWANAGGDAAHLGGMIAGAIYVFSEGWRSKMKLQMRSGQWEKNVTTQRDLQIELDSILRKVHDSGIHSLTAKEKRILKKATKAEQMRQRPNT